MAPSSRARPVLTARALALSVLVVLLIVVLAAPVQRYLASRGEVSAAAAQLSEDRHQLRVLQAQKARWSDPGYLQQQARVKLNFAMPGDTVYVVAGTTQKNEIEQTRSDPGSGAAAKPGWNARLWDSLHRADR